MKNNIWKDDGHFFTCIECEKKLKKIVETICECGEKFDYCEEFHKVNYGKPPIHCHKCRKNRKKNKKRKIIK